LGVYWIYAPTVDKEDCDVFCELQIITQNKLHRQGMEYYAVNKKTNVEELFYPLVRHYIKGLHERPKNVSKSKRMKFS
jgi:hypothetical protein